MNTHYRKETDMFNLYEVLLDEESQDYDDYSYYMEQLADELREELARVDTSLNDDR